MERNTSLLEQILSFLAHLNNVQKAIGLTPLSVAVTTLLSNLVMDLFMFDVIIDTDLTFIPYPLLDLKVKVTDLEFSC